MKYKIPEEFGTVCAYGDCPLPVTHLARGRSSWGSEGHPQVAAYCEYHAGVVADENSPEYSAECPHCGCQFGMN